MKKIIYLICFGMVLLPLFANAQQVVEQKVKLGKTEVSGFIATSMSEKPLVEDALTSKLTDAGITKHGKKKKFYTCKGVSVPEISPNKVDLYYRVQSKKHKSLIYFVVSKGYDNYVSTATDATTAGNVINFLGKIDSRIARTAEIKQKEEDIKKVEEEKKKKEQELEDLKKK